MINQCEQIFEWMKQKLFLKSKEVKLWLKTYGSRHFKKIWRITKIYYKKALTNGIKTSKMNKMAILKK